MDFSSILKRIYDIETRLPVNDWKLDQTPIWPLLRIQLHFALLNRMDLTGKINIQPKGSIKNNHRELPEQWNHTVDAVFYSKSHFREELNGVFWNRHCDPLRVALEEQGISTILFERSGSRQHQYPVACEESFYTDPNNSINTGASPFEIRKIIERLQLRMSAKWDKYELFLEELSKLGINSVSCKSFSKESIIKRFFKLRKRSASAEGFLRIAKPRVVFITCYYGAESLAVVWACRRLKIPIVDIQHGMQHHAAYQNWTAKTLGDLSFCPTHFWVWSKDDKSKLDTWIMNFTSISAIRGGYPWAKLVRTEKKSSSFNHSLKALQGDKKIGLISLPGYEPDIPDYLIDAVKRSSKRILWLVRTHPRLPETGKVCIEKFEIASINAEALALASNTPLITLLEDCDFHLTWESTVIHEAYLSGVPSIAIEPDAEMIFPEVKAAGFLLIANETTLLKEINKLSGSAMKSTQEPPHEDCNVLSSLIRDAPAIYTV
jgi:hypothetical protein